MRSNLRAWWKTSNAMFKVLLSGLLRWWQAHKNLEHKKCTLIKNSKRESFNVGRGFVELRRFDYCKSSLFSSQFSWTYNKISDIVVSGLEFRSRALACKGCTHSWNDTRRCTDTRHTYILTYAYNISELCGKIEQSGYKKFFTLHSTCVTHKP